MQDLDLKAAQEAPAESEGLLNLLLLADSSLLDSSDDRQEFASVSFNSKQSSNSSSRDKPQDNDKVQQHADHDDKQRSGNSSRSLTPDESLSQQGMPETAPTEAATTRRSSTGGAHCFCQV